MTLEDLIREAAEHGLHSLTLFKTGQGWQAAAKSARDVGFRISIEPEPVKALLGVFRQPVTPPAKSSAFD